MAHDKKKNHMLSYIYYYSADNLICTNTLYLNLYLRKRAFNVHP
jgi:hypothetical protein